VKLSIENILIGFIAILAGIVCICIMQYNRIDDNEIFDPKVLEYLSSIEQYVEKDVTFDTSHQNNANIVVLKKRIYTKKEINKDINLLITSFLKNS